MPPIRIHFGYRTTDAPWGGANNFLRALRAELESGGGYVFTASIDEPCDILFMNQLSTGPGQQTTLERVQTIRQRNVARRLVVRAVNLNRHAFRMGLRNLLFGRRTDVDVVALLNSADGVVFQSRYQQEMFAANGYRGARHIVIHNGADRVFWADVAPSRPRGDVLRVASSTASPRASKRHDLIARLSGKAGVEVVHFGNWPDGLDSGRVRRHGMVPREQMAALYRECDYFFHPAIKDPCPNAVFEAICSGLPVIYNPGPGSTPEIVGPNGFPLDERSLDATIDRARASLDQLKRTVIQNREAYTVQRAACEYAKVFAAAARE